jgi:general secretion pathway protein G
MSRSFKLFIIALLLGIAIVIPRFGSAPIPKRLIAAEVDIANFNTTLTMFQQDCGRYPTTVEGLGALINRPTAIPAGGKWHPYLAVDKLPKDPWGRPYIYECPGKHNPGSFDVYSVGPSGKGGNEAIGNWTPVQTQ